MTTSLMRNFREEKLNELCNNKQLRASLATHLHGKEDEQQQMRTIPSAKEAKGGRFSASSSPSLLISEILLLSAVNNESK